MQGDVEVDYGGYHTVFVGTLGTLVDIKIR